MMASRHLRKLNATFSTQWSQKLPTNITIYLNGSTRVITPATPTFQQCLISSSSVRWQTSTPKKGGDDLHHLFQEQMKELEAERCELFGNDNTDIVEETMSTDGKDMMGNDGMTIEERNQERDAIYNFSQEERVAWGNGSGGSQRKHSAMFMEAIEKAREAKVLMESEQKEKEKVTINQIAKDFQETLSFKEKLQQESSILKENNEKFTHLNSSGDQVSMVDVGHKQVTRRVAKARSTVIFPPEVMEAMEWNSSSAKQEIMGPKGPIFATARLAGIMGAK